MEKRGRSRNDATGAKEEKRKSFSRKDAKAQRRRRGRVLDRINRMNRMR
jgi:hypothetical protein